MWQCVRCVARSAVAHCTEPGPVPSNMLCTPHCGDTAVDCYDKHVGKRVQPGPRTDDTRNKNRFRLPRIRKDAGRQATIDGYMQASWLSQGANGKSRTSKSQHSVTEFITQCFTQLGFDIALKIRDISSIPSLCHHSYAIQKTGFHFCSHFAAMTNTYMRRHIYHQRNR